MFAKLKKKIAEEAATGPRSGRMPRSMSKESITSVGADSGDDFMNSPTGRCPQDAAHRTLPTGRCPQDAAHRTQPTGRCPEDAAQRTLPRGRCPEDAAHRTLPTGRCPQDAFGCLVLASDGSSSRDDLSSQILRRNDQIRKLEAKLSASMRKFQEQNESFQANRAKMAEGMALALEKKDQEWMEKTAALEQEKASLEARLEQSLSLFQKRDEQDELEGFQLQELAKVKHMLLRKEEQLSLRERELKQRGEELNTARLTLTQTQDKLYELGEEHEEMSRINSQLRAQRDELLTEREEMEKKVSDMVAREQELQQLIQQVSEDFQKAQSDARSLQKALDSLKAEHSELELQHEQHKNTAAVTEEERERILAGLQEKALSLERRLEANFSQDEHLQELLKEARTHYTGFVLSSSIFLNLFVLFSRVEKSALEQRLEEARGELLEERTKHTTAVSSLEAQISRLNTNVSELQTLLRHKDDSSRSYRERTDSQIADLEQRLADSGEKLKGLEQQLAESEAHKEKLVRVQAASRCSVMGLLEWITLLVGWRGKGELKKAYVLASGPHGNLCSLLRQKVEWSEERERLQQQVSTQRQRGLEKTAKLEEEMLVLQREREAENNAHQESMRLLEAEKNSLLKSKAEVESTVEKLSSELQQSKAELSSRQTVSVEIAKALEETRKQREELQQQVAEMSESLQRAEQEVRRLTEQVGVKEAELSSLKEDLQTARSGLSSLQAEYGILRSQAEQKDQERISQIESLQQELLTHSQQHDSCQSKVFDLQSEVESLTAQLQDAEVCVSEQNGVVAVGDLDQLQKANKELEQQLSEKNKTIRQLQQRLAELKRTLQKELKLKPDADSESKEKLPDGRQERPAEKPSSETPALSAVLTPAPTSTHAAGPGGITAHTTVTNSSDLTDTREINFEYLKHVVLKFMSSREAEAFQLIKAVSVLLHFTREEEDMLKQTLEYKMSWFGSKPSPKGIIRPSISGTPSSWSGWS
ncbi:hypothetical protein NFI96_014361 [Prochilodus magdalenae]|nr:hypothetical protein NFI96_014361 [Prochilodus magdalenae]